jgi:hypothetical protein
MTLQLLALLVLLIVAAGHVAIAVVFFRTALGDLRRRAYVEAGAACFALFAWVGAAVLLFVGAL